MLYLYQSIFSYSFRHLIDFLPCKCFFYDKSALLLIILNIRVHYLIQHGPHVESKHNVIRICTRNRQISAVFYMNFCYFIQKLCRRVFCKYIYNTRIDSHTDHSHIPLFLPGFMTVKIVFCHRFSIAVLNTKSVSRIFHRNRPGSHASVICTRFKCSVKNHITCKRWCCIHHKINLMLPDQFCHFLCICRINLRSFKTGIPLHHTDNFLCPFQIIVADQHIFQPFSLLVSPLHYF